MTIIVITVCSICLIAKATFCYLLFIENFGKLKTLQITQQTVNEFI